MKTELAATVSWYDQLTPVGVDSSSLVFFSFFLVSASLFCFLLPVSIIVNEYIYSPMKAAHKHRDKKVCKIDRGQNYTQKKKKRKNYIELTKQS